MSTQHVIARLAAAAGAATLLLSLAAGPVAASSVHATVANGTLRITGTPSADRIALRRSHAHPNKLQVDIGDNGSADFTFALSSFTAIDVEAGAGNDRVRIDDRNGAFTTTKRTTLNGQDGNDTLIGGRG